MDELASAAVAPIRSGMVVGLGTGRAAARGVRALAARRSAEALDLQCVATSDSTAELARGLGLTVVPLDGVAEIDYLFDGADEVDPALRMIKGGGGAMTRERIAAAAARSTVFMLDASKLSTRLGDRRLLPVEVLPVAWASARQRLAQLGLVPTLRIAGEDHPAEPFITDNGGVILDCVLPAGVVDGPHGRAGSGDGLDSLAARLDAMPGVVDHGLFLREARAVLIEHPDGRIEPRAR